MRRTIGTLAVASLAVLMASVPASAATRNVTVGTPPSAQKQVGNLGGDLNAYYPRSTQIAAGDKVKFRLAGFHDVFIAAGDAEPPGALAPTGDKVSGSNDAAGTPFWFNGQDNIGFNGQLFASNLWGKKARFSGAESLESGFFTGNKAPKPMTVTFTKAGTYNYFCNLHVGMRGTVKVLKKGRRVRSAKNHNRVGKKELAASVKRLKALPSATIPSDEISVGGAGSGGEELFAFLPDAKTVPVGSTIKFAMDPDSYDVHTATTGPGDPGAEADSYLRQIAASFEGGPAFDPRGVYASDQPPAVASLTGTTHGNGFWNSGAMDSATVTPLPTSNSVKFDQAGVYTFWCLIHPFMKATVTVEG